MNRLGSVAIALCAGTALATATLPGFAQAPATPPAGQTPAGQAPAGAPPAGQPAGGQAPAGQAPAAQTPAGQTPAAPAGAPQAGQPAAGQTPGGQTPATQTPAAAGQAPAGQMPAGENAAMTMDEFVTFVIASNQLEIATSRMALERGRDEGLRHFATRMVEDHTLAAEIFPAVLEVAEVPAPQAGEMTNAEPGMMDRLTDATDANFDREYLQIQVEAHENATAAFATYAATGDNDTLRIWAGMMLPALTQHLAIAQQLLDTLTANGTTNGGAGMPGMPMTPAGAAPAQGNAAPATATPFQGTAPGAPGANGGPVQGTAPGANPQGTPPANQPATPPANQPATPGNTPAGGGGAPAATP